MKSLQDNLIFPYVLDHKPGFFLGWFLYRLFKRVHLDENMKDNLKQMQKDGTIVYTIKYRGRLDYLLYHYNFRRRRLPYPKIAFDLNISMLLPFTRFVKIFLSHLAALIKYGRRPSPYRSGFYRNAIRQNTTCLLFLVDPKGFLTRFIHEEKDHLEFLLELQREQERPIFLVPQLILYKKTPEKAKPNLLDIFFGFKDHPGTLRKIVLFFRYNRKALIDFGPPLNLQTYLAQQPADRPLPEMASEIRNKLVEEIDNQKRVVLGPIVKSRQEIKEIVLMHPHIREKIANMALGDPKKLKSLRKNADDYFEEIAADYNSAYVQFFHRTLTWFWKKIFEGIDVDPADLAKVRDWARRGPIIYVPSHKSHIDYLIINYVLYLYNMHIPRIAAGVNLTFWPMGHIFRKSGAFFIRRSFKNASLYVEVFNGYIKTLLQEGYPLEFYIEGGRSRNGKLVLPKTGFLSILLQAYQEGFCKDLVFAPASIIYDRVMEEKSYLKEISGASKEHESLGQVLKARKFLKRKYGKVYIRFHEPFSVKEYLGGADSVDAQTRRALAFHLVRSINAVSLVTPLSLVALSILSNHRRGFLQTELTATANTLTEFLAAHGFPMTETLQNPGQAVKETLALLIDWKILETLEDTSGTEEIFYYVDEDRKIALEYYKNSIIHFFIPQAFVAVALLGGHEEVKSLDRLVHDYAFLQNLFKHEFVFETREDPEQKVRAVLAYFRKIAFWIPAGNPDTYLLTKAGYEKLPIWAGLAKTFIESYWIAAKALGQKNAALLKKEDLIKNMHYLGKRFHKLGVIDHIGALSRLNFENALNLIQEQILNDPEESESAPEKLTKLAQKLYTLARFNS